MNEAEPIQRRRSQEGDPPTPIKGGFVSQQFNTWLLQLEEKPENISSTTRLVHASIVATAILEATVRGITDPERYSLNDLLTYLDQDSTDIEDQSLLDLACVQTAEDWLDTHPQSQEAKVISEQGITAPLFVHANLTLAMFGEYLDSKNIPPPKRQFPFIIFEKISPQQ